MTLDGFLNAVASFMQKVARPFATIAVSLAIAHAIERNPVWDVLAVGAFIVTGHVVSRGFEKIFGQQKQQGGGN
jgi:hypothetical protein